MNKVAVSNHCLPLNCIECGTKLRDNDLNYQVVADKEYLRDIECWNDSCSKDYRYYKVSGNYSWLEPIEKHVITGSDIILMEDLFPSIWQRILNWFKRRK